jgi:hypothetical protein
MPQTRFRTLALALIVGAAGVSAFPARADGPAASGRVRSYRTPWTDIAPSIYAEVRVGLPFVTLVIVPLCNNAQIACGGGKAGDPSSLDGNLYWGRGFGVRRFLGVMPKTWERIATSGADGHVLEQVVYRREVAGELWGRDADDVPVEQLLILRAVHGDGIDRAVDDFMALAEHGGEVTFRESKTEGERRVRVHVAGYAGHNRLMDGKKLAQRSQISATATPSFVLACRSDAYFSNALRATGSEPLVMTRDLMAPEGYVIEAMARALGDRVTDSMLRQRVVSAYAKWQRIPERTASLIFAR